MYEDFGPLKPMFDIGWGVPNSPARGNPNAPQTPTPAPSQYTDDHDAFRSTIGYSESGNNYSPGETGINPYGYAGKYQFGRARLDHLGYGHVSLEDFVRNPDLQEEVMNAHMNKMDEEISQFGFDKYIGQTVNGVPINRKALYGGLHLGGPGGVKAFLSGSDRKDAYGTSVSRYMKMHGNGAAATYADRQAKDVADTQVDIANLREELAQYEQNAFMLNASPEDMAKASGFQEPDQIKSPTSQGMYTPTYSSPNSFVPGAGYRTAAADPAAAYSPAISDNAPYASPRPKARPHMVGDNDAPAHLTDLFADTPSNEGIPAFNGAAVKNKDTPGPDVSRFDVIGNKDNQSPPPDVLSTRSADTGGGGAAPSTSDSPEEGKGVEGRRRERWEALGAIGLGFSQLGAWGTPNIDNWGTQRRQLDLEESRQGILADKEARLADEQALKLRETALTEQGRMGLAQHYMGNDPQADPNVARAIALNAGGAADNYVDMLLSKNQAASAETQKLAQWAGNSPEAQAARDLVADAVKSSDLATDEDIALIQNDTSGMAAYEALQERYKKNTDERRIARMDPQSVPGAVRQFAESLPLNDPQRAHFEKIAAVADIMLKTGDVDGLTTISEQLSAATKAIIESDVKVSETRAVEDIKLQTGIKLDDAKFQNIVKGIELKDEKDKENFQSKVDAELELARQKHGYNLTEQQEADALDRATWEFKEEKTREQNMPIANSIRERYPDGKYEHIARLAEQDPVEAYKFLDDEQTREIEAEEKQELEDQKTAVVQRFDELIASELDPEKKARLETMRTYADQGDIEGARKLYEQLSEVHKDQLLAEWLVDASPDRREALLELRRAASGTGDKDVVFLNRFMDQLDRQDVDYPNWDKMDREMAVLWQIASQDDFDTGPLTSFFLPINQAAEQLGADLNLFGDLNDSELFAGISSGLIQFLRKEGSGPMSDWDGARIQESISSLGKSPDGNRAIIQLAMRTAQQKMAKRDAQEAYLMEGGDIKDKAALDAYIRKYAADSNVPDQAFYDLGHVGGNMRANKIEGHESLDAQLETARELVEAGKLRDGDMIMINGDMKRWSSEVFNQ